MGLDGANLLIVGDGYAPGDENVREVDGEPEREEPRVEGGHYGLFMSLGWAGLRTCRTPQRNCAGFS